MNETHVTILVVDDDREIAHAIEKLLTREGYRVRVAFDGLEALDILSADKRSGSIDAPICLILLDVMMPRLDGLSATLKIRERFNIPILILSAKTEETDKILGLSMGADDYIQKPFSPPELLARVKSQLRRYMHLGDVEGRLQQGHAIQNGRLTLDTQAKTLLVDGEPTHLTATEYKIVELFMRNLGVVFSAEQIYERVWKDPAFSVENTVMVHIRRIREKIELSPREPDYLKVVWGIGYKMEKMVYSQGG